jgi:HAE1 family hydrophobic/amphiphilic exporter-1
MSLPDLCIRRPVLTLMMMLSLLVFGVLGYERLGVDQFPSMEFPVVSVIALNEGASPEVMEEDVTDVLEEQLNTIAGLRSLTSTTMHGATRIAAEFELSRDLDGAAQDVRDKIAAARIRLPKEMEAPSVQKINFSNFAILWIPLITDRPIADSTEFVRYQVKPQIETIPGVGAIEFFGRLDRNIRIWLDGDALRARGLAATDVLRALQQEHVEIPGGRVVSRAVEYSVKTAAEFRSLEELEGLAVSYANGAVVRLRDVARVEDGTEDVRVDARYGGAPSVGLGVLKQPGANTVAIADEVYERLADIRKTLPAGLSFGEQNALIDFSLSIRESVDETLFALWFGAVLAVLTVWAFLRRTRPTLIVAAAIPLSLVATFGVMYVIGYTLNVMTLLAMALAVGVVVDDAIVVLENVERHRENGESPYDAASKGTREIAFAATAATFSIAAVFAPVVFVGGILGNFLAEFGVTVASAVLVSLFVALTLTPMLAARMSPPKEREHGSVYHRLERAFRWLERHYRSVLYWSLDHRAATLGTAVASFVASLGFGAALGGEFFPPSDEGRFLVRMETPPGTTLEATRELLEQDEAWVLAQPEVAGLFSGVGVAGPDGPGTTSHGIMFATLRPRDERERGAHELMRLAREHFSQIPGQKVKVFDMGGMMTAGSAGADVEFALRGDASLEELDRLSDELIRRLGQRGGYVDLDKTLSLGLPEVRVLPDRDKAAALGIDATTLATVIQVMIGGLDVAEFKEGGHSYDIRMRLEAEDRDRPAAIEGLYVRTRDGGLVELRNLVKIETGAAPSEITRRNRQRSVTVHANLEGKTLREAIDEAGEICGEILPDNVRLALTGEAEEYRETVGEFGMMLLLSVLVIYMLLAAQFESLVHPLTVMLALPLAMVGALGGLWLFGMTLNLFSAIGILLLFGLVTKNSILLVDYANQLRDEGMDKLTAMRTAAPIRMRPVLMTAVSMIFGVLPAGVGVGPGAESRQPMAIATGAGMFSSMALTLIVVPVFYIVLDDFVEGIRRRLRGGSAPRSVTLADERVNR